MAKWRLQVAEVLGLCADGESEAGRGQSNLFQDHQVRFFSPEREFCGYVLKKVYVRSCLSQKMSPRWTTHQVAARWLRCKEELILQVKNVGETGCVVGGWGGRGLSDSQVRKQGCC